MKIFTTLRIIATIFILIAAVLLILLVVNVISGADAREALKKFAAVCGIIAVASFAVSFLNNGRA